MLTMRSPKILTYVLFIAMIVIDWIYILIIQKNAPFITHWVIAMPFITPLFFAMTLLALIGMYVKNPWGYALAYLALFLSLFLSALCYYSQLKHFLTDDAEFFVLAVLNLFVIFYMIYFNITHSIDEE